MSATANDRAARVTGAFHAGITVADLESSLAFYEGLLGLELVAQRAYEEEFVRRIVGVPEASVITIAFLRVPGSEFFLELLAYEGADQEPVAPRPSDPGGGHVCLYVENIEAWHEQLSQAGVPLLSDRPVPIEEGATKGSKCLYARDPDGYYVELFETATQADGANGVRDDDNDEEVTE